MKANILFIILIIFLSSCSVDFQIKVENQSDFKLTQKSVEISREKLEKLYGNLPEAEVAELVSIDGIAYPAQFDDLDGDGKWDVLFTQIDLEANEERLFNLNLEVEQEVLYKTNIRFADKNDASKEFTSSIRLKTDDTKVTQKVFQFEGPGWENDVVAFRNYFDARNGIDIFGKTTTEMALDICGLKDGQSYHELQPWGMELLKVGNYLGAGAIAIQTGSGLYRVGPDCEGSVEVIKEGPIRSILDFYFADIIIDDQKVNLKHRVSIEAGKPYYKSEVWMDGIDNAKLVTGIVNLHSDSVFSGVIDNYSYFYTHDNQAFDGEKLGMAVLIPDSNLEVKTAPEEGEGITQTFYAGLDQTEQAVEFYFMVGWELQNNKYADKKKFENEIEDQILQLASQTKIVLQINGEFEQL